jgi:NAD+ kinase
MLILKVVYVNAMRLAVYIGKDSGEQDNRVKGLLQTLGEAGVQLSVLAYGEAPTSEIDMLLSVGGDGTFLYSAKLVKDSGIPVLGVNIGRVGFLSENRPEDVADAILAGEYTIEDRTVLKAAVVSSDSSSEAATH